MSRSPFNSYMEDDIRTKYALWLAEYGSQLNYSGSVGMWQKSSTGRISGINSNVDMNECYVDYPKQIKADGKNGFEKPKPEEPKPEPVPELVERLRGVDHISSHLSALTCPMAKVATRGDSLSRILLVTRNIRPSLSRLNTS